MGKGFLLKGNHGEKGPGSSPRRASTPDQFSLLPEQEDALEVIVKLPRLEALFMTGCGAMTDAALALLVAAKPNLRELEFGGSAAVTDAGLACLSQLRGALALHTLLTPCLSLSVGGLACLCRFRGAPPLPRLLTPPCLSLSGEALFLPSLVMGCASPSLLPRFCLPLRK